MTRDQHRYYFAAIFGNSSMEESSREKEREKFIAIARRHFERKGYRVHSGLQFGVELVLYAGELCVLKITC